MRGLVRAESSAERAAREAAEVRNAQAGEQASLFQEQNRLLARQKNVQPEIALRLYCGHVAFSDAPNIASWLKLDSEKVYYCRKCECDALITASSPDAMSPSSGGR
jgi:hypothetical protein